MRNRDFRWDEEKNRWLKKERNLSFEAVVAASEGNRILDDIDHPTRHNQRILIVEINDYVCAVPYVKDENAFFLKTIYPSRAFERKYKVSNEQ